ncbi:hypothetical protein [Streptomyces sp. NPDC101132]|uniref:hypothetical protein n=1 Tax=Streptomyces sp. NPDC101132 TaxID=3366110 RepID=UPI00381D6A85
MKDHLIIVRSWAGVHAGRSAVTLIAVSGLLSLIGAQAMIDSLGFLLFETPVSLLLFVPALAGIAVGMGTANTARIPLPEPHRLLTARLLWLLALTAVAGLAVSLGQLVGPAIDWQAGVRNLLLHSSLAVITVSFAGPALAWLPPVTLTLACMFFGYPQAKPGYYWWAAIMEESVSPRQWVWTVVIFLGAIVFYALRPLTKSHLGRYTLGGIHADAE